MLCGATTPSFVIGRVHLGGYELGVVNNYLLIILQKYSLETCCSFEYKEVWGHILVIFLTFLFKCLAMPYFL